MLILQHLKKNNLPLKNCSNILENLLSLNSYISLNKFSCFRINRDLT